MTEQPGPGHMVMAAARILARRRMGACETTPPATRREPARDPDNPDRNQLPFLALDDLAPLAGVELVRPRRCAAAGAPARLLAARREDTGTCEEDPEEQSAQPGRQDVGTGPDPYALLTVVALMGAADRVFPVFMTLASLPAGRPHGVRHLDGGVDRRPPQDQRRGTRGGTIRMPLVSST